MKPNRSGFAKKKKTFPIKASPPHPYVLVVGWGHRLSSLIPFIAHLENTQVAKWLAPWVSLETSKNPNKETTYQHQTKKQAKIQNETFTLLSPTFSDFSLTEPVLEDCSVASRPAAPAAHSTWHGLLPFMLAHDLRVQLQEFQARLHPRTP